MVIKKCNRSELAQKFMQVGIDVKCMHTNFGGCTFSGFGDIATFKNGQISLSDHGHQKIQSFRIGSKKSCKYNLMPNACTPILVGMAILVSEILLPSKTTKFPFPTMVIKKFNRSELAQKFMLV